MSWYKIGTIAATNGSKIITGAGTQFTNPLNGVSAGRMLLLPAAGTVQIYEIESVQSDTQLTLVSVFNGTTGTGKAYAIPTSPAVSVEQFAHEFASTLAYYQQQLSGWQQILTGAGNVTLTTPDGQSVTVRSQQAWDAALTGKLSAGDYGIGGAVPKAITQQGMHFSYSDTVAAGTDLGLANNGVGYQSAYNTNRRGQIFQSFGDGQLRHRLSLSSTAADATSAWRVVWDNANLVKQTQSLAATGNVLIAGLAGGAGSENSQLLPNATLASDFRVNGVWYAQTAQQTDVPVNGYLQNLFGNPSRNYGVQNLIDVRNNTPSFRYRTIENNNVGNWHELATTDTAQTFSGEKIFSGGFQDNTTNIGRTRSLAPVALTDVAQLSNMRNGGVIFINAATSTPALMPGGSTSAYWFISCIGKNDATANAGMFRAVQQGTTGDCYLGWLNGAGTITWNALLNANAAQTITGAKTFTQHTLVANARSFAGTSTTNIGVNLGRVTTANLVELGDENFPTAIRASAMPQVRIGTGTAYDIVDSGTAQTIGGQKTFTSAVNIRAANPTVGLEASGIAETTIGRWMQLTNNGGALRIFIRAGNNNAPIGTGERIITFPTAATGAVLISGNNAVADANGFWKTASPVVKLFADGTSELTSEAESITTERLSEGVYRISGCLGLNADRAWGGDEGGIDVPMCRNKLPRLWVDYGGDEGREQINPDGSIVIRTYHRPHPDAPAFARNEIEGYANGDPIDIPSDTFISVRVQMPEREEAKPKVMHSNVYCNTVVRAKRKSRAAQQ